MSELPPLSWGLSEEQSDMIKANKLTWHVNEKGTIIVTRKSDGKRGYGASLRQAIEDL